MAKTETPLDSALEATIVKTIKVRDFEAFKELLHKGFDLEASLASEEGRTALALAEAYRASEISRALLHAGADWRKAGMTLLHPVYDLDLISTKRFIAEGADVNQASRIGNVLQVAVGRNFEGIDAGTQFEIVRALLEAGADVNVGVLQKAVENNRTDLFNLLLKFGATVPREGDLLARMIHAKNREVAQALIKGGADVNERASLKVYDEKGEYKARYANASVLSIAVQVGDEVLVQNLIDAGADLHQQDEDGVAPLEWAQRLKHKNIVAILEKTIAKKPRKANPSGDLIFAVEKGDLDLVRSLLHEGADASVRDRRTKTNDFTPLMLAAYAGHAEVAKALLDAKVDITAKDAGEKHNDGGFSFIYNEMGADGCREAVYSLHRTALAWAAFKGHADVVKVLIDHGADVNVLDRVKSTPLLLAAEAGSVDSVKHLLAGGADISIRDRSKESALSLATHRIEIVEVLLAAGAKVEMKDNNGNTPLLRAAARARPEVVEALLKAGAKLTTINRIKETPLHRALDTQFIQKNYSEQKGPHILFKIPQERIDKTIRMLIDAGADPTAENKFGDTPIKQAKNLAKLTPFYEPYIALLEDAAKNRPQMPAKAPPKPQAPKVRKEPKKKPAVHAPDLPTPHFTHAAQSAEYQKALADLEEICGSKRQPFDRAPGGFSFHVHSSKTVGLTKVHTEFLNRGFYVFTPESLSEQQLVILPTKKRDEVIAAMQTNGANYDLMPSDVATWLNELEKEQPFVLTGIGFDFASGEFLTKITKPAQLAKKMYEFCPDIVDQGTGDVKELAAQLKRSNKLFFWWD